ncbi:hydroxyacid dehydrogenase [Candidatus Woesearchaeota archaeon]|jgi:D-lactate dehydrogenase|nr:hydroxyacid dehydrogenase [Candidatus Woesearchaeota archaeon]MBT5342239.1 hydroxyacid dehydrogenase [Candidatus Woesearchaeota archaeon]
MLKIGLFELEPWEEKVIKTAFPKDKLFFSKKKLTLQSAKKHHNLEAMAVFVHSEINKEILKKLPKLKYITTMSTGFDHIDVAACKERKVSVSNVPVYGENTVAEHAFALILALSRKIVDCVERTKRGSFELKGLRGFDLKNKTIGIIGGGNIGQHVIRMAKGFEMKVLVFDLNKDKNLAKKMGFQYTSMDKLLKESDVVSLHVPYNKHTHHLINKNKLSLMKKNAILINTSRGGIIDTDALVTALKRKKIAGAGLDVLEEECEMIEDIQLLKKEFVKKCDLKIIVENHILLDMPNVIITPHNAFNTNEALMRILETTVKNIRGYKSGRKINLVK